jgi:hypothetical protein
MIVSPEVVLEITGTETGAVDRTVELKPGDVYPYNDFLSIRVKTVREAH